MKWILTAGLAGVLILLNLCWIWPIECEAWWLQLQILWLMLGDHIGRGGII